MRREKLLSIALMLNALLFLACDKSVSPAKPSYVGIVQTDTSGNIISDDDEDWQPRASSQPSGALPTLFSAWPAYPNPAGTAFQAWGNSGPAGRVCILQYALPELATVSLIINRSPEDTARTLLANEWLQAGKFRLVWDLNDNAGASIENGIYRAHLYAETADSTYHIFGDIEVKR